jgi:hypothetical protein
MSEALCKFVHPDLNVSYFLNHIQDLRNHMNKPIRQPNQMFLYRLGGDETQGHVCLLSTTRGYLT